MPTRTFVVTDPPGKVEAESSTATGGWLGRAVTVTVTVAEEIAPNES